MPIELAVGSTLKQHHNNDVMLDCWIQWASNPTSMSAGFGLEENYPLIRTNLVQRYSLNIEDAERYTKTLRDESNQLIKSGYDIYELRKEIKRQLGEEWHTRLKEKLEKASLDVKRAAYLLYTLESRGFDVLNFLSWSWFEFIDQFLAYYAAAYGSILSKPIIDELSRIGVWNKLEWISSNRSTRRTETIIAPHPPLEALTFNEAVLFEKKTDAKQIIERLLNESRFEEMRLIDEVSRAPFGFRKFQNETPAVEGNSSFYTAYRNGVAISPFLLDQVRKTLYIQKQNRINRSGQAIENKIIQFCKDLWPDCELVSKTVGEQFLWRVDSSIHPSLYIYLTLWLTEADLKSLFPERSTNAVFLILNQSIPSAKRVLASKVVDFRYLELLFPVAGNFRCEKVTGERYGYADKIIELICNSTIASSKGPEASEESELPDSTTSKTVHPRIEDEISKELPIDEVIIANGQMNKAENAIEKWLAKLTGDVISELDFIDKTTFGYLDSIPKKCGIRIITSNVKEVDKCLVRAEKCALDRPYFEIININKMHQRWIGSKTSFFIDIGTDLKSDALGHSTHAIRKLKPQAFGESVSHFQTLWNKPAEELKETYGSSLSKSRIYPK